ncbi:hypothetical protein SDC9_141786 [bioreactor metagenome]|uniref:Uncharacterized protein n=1 Tax=bioreactor metagenome TaxID=1076179 RepID=A0A645DZS3_9ZZZZ
MSAIFRFSDDQITMMFIGSHQIKVTIMKEEIGPKLSVDLGNFLPRQTLVFRLKNKGLSRTILR